MFTMTPYVANSWQGFSAGTVKNFTSEDKIRTLPNFLFLERTLASEKIYLFTGVGKGLYFLRLLFIQRIRGGKQTSEARFLFGNPCTKLTKNPPQLYRAFSILFLTGPC
jgi:hypothetical protein